MPPENPFVFDRPLVDKRDLLEREEQLAELVAAARAGRDVLVEGPYRHGKTSLVNAALAELAGDGSTVGVHVDCSGILTANDFVARLEDGYGRAWASGPVEETLSERVEALSLVAASTPESHLEELLRLPGEVAEQAGSRAVVCFDEAQDALAVPAVLEALMRQRRAEVSRIFAGPEITSDAAAWSRRAATVTVGRIDPIAFAGAIAKRFKETGRDAGENPRVLATVGASHPQRTNMLAAVLWEMTPEGERAPVWKGREAIDEAVRRSTPEFEARWEALHGNERRVAVAIANGLAPQGTIAQREVGLAGFGAAQRAVRGIESRGVAAAGDGGMTLTDPLFAEWLRTRYPQIRSPGGRDWGMPWREAERGYERGG
jgi:hypothetical protein